MSTEYHNESEGTRQEIEMFLKRDGFLNQSGNDRWAIESVFHGKRNGYFIEAGAADGTFWAGGSSTYVLEKDYGWAGICIEPNPNLFKYLSQHRKCICEQLALYSSSGEIDYIDNSNGFGALSQCVYEEHLQTIKGCPIIKVKSDTLYNVLRQNNAPQIIDYLALDIEGAEVEVLKDFPFDEFSFRCVSIEKFHADHIFLKHGYVISENPFKPEQVSWERYFINPKLL